MRYEKIKSGIFIKRPNRFVAHVLTEGKEEICHVKNTGRCRELLIPGVSVILAEGKGTGRKTKYDLVAVNKGGQWINMDSQAPNQAVWEWILEGNLFSKEARVQREKKYKASRFDLYVEEKDRKAFLEVKGVTLEENQTAKFPDAPTARGIKHIQELIQCTEEGNEAYLIFVIQMKGIREFCPNWDTQPELGENLIKAKNAGVHILAWDCRVTESEMKLDQPVFVNLTKE